MPFYSISGKRSALLQARSAGQPFLAKNANPRVEKDIYNSVPFFGTTEQFDKFAEKMKKESHTSHYTQGDMDAQLPGAVLDDGVTLRNNGTNLKTVSFAYEDDDGVSSSFCVQYRTDRPDLFHVVVEKNTNAELGAREVYMVNNRSYELTGEDIVEEDHAVAPLDSVLSKLNCAQLVPCVSSIFSEKGINPAAVDNIEAFTQAHQQYYVEKQDDQDKEKPAKRHEIRPAERYIADTRNEIAQQVIADKMEKQVLLNFNAYRAVATRQKSSSNEITAAYTKLIRSIGDNPELKQRCERMRMMDLVSRAYEKADMDDEIPEAMALITTEGAAGDNFRRTIMQIDRTFVPIEQRLGESKKGRELEEQSPRLKAEIYQSAYKFFTGKYQETEYKAKTNAAFDRMETVLTKERHPAIFQRLRESLTQLITGQKTTHTPASAVALGKMRDTFFASSTRRKEEPESAPASRPDSDETNHNP